MRHVVHGEYRGRVSCVMLYTTNIMVSCVMLYTTSIVVVCHVLHDEYSSGRVSCC